MAPHGDSFCINNLQQDHDPRIRPFYFASVVLPNEPQPWLRWSKDVCRERERSRSRCLTWWFIKSGKERDLLSHLKRVGVWSRLEHAALFRAHAGHKQGWEQAAWSRAAGGGPKETQVHHNNANHINTFDSCQGLIIYLRLWSLNVVLFPWCCKFLFISSIFRFIVVLNQLHFFVVKVVRFPPCYRALVSFSPLGRLFDSTCVHLAPPSQTI